MSNETFDTTISPLNKVKLIKPATMYQIDLHTHSTVSDGTLTQHSLVQHASEAGLSTIALADHDTVEGIEEALTAGREFKIEVIPAVELSVDHEDGSLHLLGYYIDHKNKELLNILDELKMGREKRNLKIIARLNELGHSIALEEVVELSPDGTYGRAHIAKLLLRTGKFIDLNEIFDTLLGPGAEAYFDRSRLQLSGAINVIHRAGGLAVWAHPGLHEDKLNGMLSRLEIWKGYGLDGLESDYFNHSLELRDRLRKLAVINGMIYTGGSDFHGSIKPENKIGLGPAGVPIDIDCLEMLQRRLELKRLAISSLK